jgi:hypothetical protein
MAVRTHLEYLGHTRSQLFDAKGRSHELTKINLEEIIQSTGCQIDAYANDGSRNTVARS